MSFCVFVVSVTVLYYVFLEMIRNILGIYVEYKLTVGYKKCTSDFVFSG